MRAEPRAKAVGHLGSGHVGTHLAANLLSRVSGWRRVEGDLAELPKKGCSVGKWLLGVRSLLLAGG